MAQCSKVKKKKKPTLLVTELQPDLLTHAVCSLCISAEPCQSTPNVR